MSILIIEGLTQEEFKVNLEAKVAQLNKDYVAKGIKTLELETSCEVTLYAEAPEDDEYIWAADFDFAILYRKDFEEGYIEVIWAKSKWVVGKNRTDEEINAYLKNESIDDRIFFIEEEQEKVLN